MTTRIRVNTVQSKTIRIKEMGPPGVSGTVDWGLIQGTLANQTDLQTALNNKEAANANIQTHISTTGNPHNTTAGDVSAIPSSYGTNTHVPSGFIDHSTSSLSLVENVDAVNDTFEVTITGTDFPVFVNGTLLTKNTESITQVAAASKRYYIFYAPDGTLSIDDSEWALDPGYYGGAAPICTVLWDATNHQGLLEEERHHAWRDVHFHHWAHHSVGPRYSSFHHSNGLNISNTGTVYSTFQVTAGEIYDEDIPNSTATSTTANLWYHHTDGTMKFVRAATMPYIRNVNSPFHPQYDNGTGLADIAPSNTNGYFVSWVYCGNTIDSNGNSQINIVIGQNTDNTMTLAEAQALSAPLLPANFVNEWKLCWKMIFRWGAGNILTHISNTDYRLAGTLPAGQAQISNVSASSVVVSPPATDVTWTTLQIALDDIAARLAAHGI